ncbi:MAG: hypothetical protein Q7J46_06635 [Pseudomonas sp.]|nr:hypothetical protein [Pseudomonas sp.]
MILRLSGLAATLYLCPAALLTKAQQADLGAKQVTVNDLSTHYDHGAPSNGQTTLATHDFAASQGNWLLFTHDVSA